MLIFAYGLVIGIFVSLIGGGGAALYLGVLTSQLGLSSAVAVPTSLLVALPALFFGFLTQLRVKNVNFHVGNQMIVAAIPGILIGTYSAQFIPKTLYNWIVGTIFIVMGAMVLFKSIHQTHNTHTDSTQVWLARFFGLLSGLMVGIGGLSGGATTAAGLTLLGLTAVESAGTATYVLMTMSSISLIGHLFTSTFAWQAGWLLMLGAIVGAVITPVIIQHLDLRRVNRVLTPFLGLLIIYFGVKMFI
ncbi:MAG: sulfite exporter TauE/SafE family protein [Furfurilactobacillus sp.]|uniref:Probable membrane transporter protein n=1 Tax=Furfurilactobacillus milii TaxID=2888272 RepID=A0ABT6D819_9LACO|nr:MULTISPECIES: sulfite exporter TauE/SafE family protein [Furfurilactobacillus]QLE65771.1 transport protein [Furfurilactobacillus rossiae]MCF6160317.1 sulfite exporter TauE/SafE family protein [Furfurilactobacillus milii]MCF6162260.1 sulfite exporter TauE/SafE family protein [Furfurilactobacillus milii]MCH4012295.1 sulfite exporter TauE/SafE family protein [Furfurilactobacillus sp.]MCH4038187.1 sulfite exporter TauE/SafE family protein [Furfurilactobacillus sp.]